MKKLACAEFRSMDTAQLGNKIVELRRKLMELRLGLVTTHNAQFASQKGALRKSIARALTIQHARFE